MTLHVSIIHEPQTLAVACADARPNARVASAIKPTEPGAMIDAVVCLDRISISDESNIAGLIFRQFSGGGDFPEMAAPAMRGSAPNGEDDGTTAGRLLACLALPPL